MAPGMFTQQEAEALAARHNASEAATETTGWSFTASPAMDSYLAGQFELPKGWEADILADYFVVHVFDSKGKLIGPVL